MINVQLFLETEQEEGYPATVKIVAEESSLVVHINLKARWGTLTSPNLCSFYGEFGKNLKQASIKAQTKQPVLSSEKPSEGVRESSLPPPSPPQPPQSSSPPIDTPRISFPSLPRGKVIWVYANLREGPGIQYRIIGKAYMKNTFEILAENLSWLRVRLENGAEGWMSRKAASGITMTSSPQSPPASSQESPRTKPSLKPPRPM
jgi:hypothetical protein